MSINVHHRLACNIAGNWCCWALWVSVWRSGSPPVMTKVGFGSRPVPTIRSSRAGRTTPAIKSGCLGHPPHVQTAGLPTATFRHGHAPTLVGEVPGPGCPSQAGRRTDNATPAAPSRWDPEPQRRETAIVDASQVSQLLASLTYNLPDPTPHPTFVFPQAWEMAP